MYMLNWDEANATLEVGIGGVVSLDEAKTLAGLVFDEIAGAERCQAVVFDWSLAKRFEFGAYDVLEATQIEVLSRGVERATMVVPDEDKVAEMIGANLQMVMEGRRSFISPRAA
jgi:hypothetical protein